jgi:ABC-2 type transport system permease protein
MGISPMTHIPQMPLEEFTIIPLIALTAIAAALTAIGFVTYSKRDVMP